MFVLVSFTKSKIATRKTKTMIYDSITSGVNYVLPRIRRDVYERPDRKCIWFNRKTD